MLAASAVDFESPFTLWNRMRMVFDGLVGTWESNHDGNGRFSSLFCILYIVLVDELVVCNFCGACCQSACSDHKPFEEGMVVLSFF